MDDLAQIQQAVRQFTQDRDWDQFHSPKNLACALSVEAAELLEHFQWVTEDQSRSLLPEKRTEVAAEIADVFLYLLQIADQLDVDLLDCARQKLIVNAEKYPVDKARGTSAKYTQL